MNQNQAPTTHNANRHYRVRFYTFVGGTTFVETAVYLIVQSAPTYVNKVPGYC